LKKDYVYESFSERVTDRERERERESEWERVEKEEKGIGNEKDREA
jgi:hypothetical protein